MHFLDDIMVIRDQGSLKERGQSPSACRAHTVVPIQIASYMNVALAGPAFTNKKK